MNWGQLKPADVVHSSYSGDFGTWTVLESVPWKDGAVEEVMITMLCLNTATQTTHSRRAASILSPTYTVLRGQDTLQRGDGDLRREART